MYQILSRKYRPQTFSEVIGQELVVSTLQQALQQEKTGQAFLFAGPRGSGKTTTARILAKALNCATWPTIEPCNVCESCREITAGNSFDFIEIDGASNRGIDDVRALRSTVMLRPAKARYKVYLIDEVHMFSEQAFNALLKTLEEPPAHVKFIFATTVPEKIPDTILSRCQRFEFRAIKSPDMSRRMNEILLKEGLSIEPEALEKAVAAARGSARDLLGYLDHAAILAKEGKITVPLIDDILGTTESDEAWALLVACAEGRIDGAIQRLHLLISEGREISLLFDALIHKIRLLLWRNLNIPILEQTAADNRFLYTFPPRKNALLIPALEMTLEAKERLRYEPLEAIPAELLLIKIALLWGSGVQENKSSVSETLSPRDSSSVAEEKASGPKNQETLLTRSSRIRSSRKKKDPVENRSLDKKEEKNLSSQSSSLSSDLSASKEIDVPIKSSPEPSCIGSVKDLEDLKACWNSFLAEIKERKVMLEAIMREGRLQSVEGDQVVIVFPEDRNFHYTMAIEHENRMIVEEALEKIAGRHYTITCEIVPAEKKRSPADDPAVKKIVTYFNGQIFDMEE